MVRRLRDEQGIALVMALGLLIVLAIVVTAAVQYTSSNTRSASSSQGRVSSRQLAEAGMNAAIAAIAGSTDPTASTDLPSSSSPATMTVNGGTITYYGQYCNLGKDGAGAANSTCAAYTTLTGWVITSTGAAPNNSASSGTAAHTVKATVQVDPSNIVQSTPPASVNPWSFLWATRTGTAGGCDETISTYVAAPLVINGNLCLTAGATQEGIWRGPLHIKGNYWSKNALARISGKAGFSTIGSNVHFTSTSAPCQNSYSVGGGTTLHACILKAGDAVTKGDNIFGPVDNSVTSITAPTPDFAHWYSSGSPGPTRSCNTSLSTGSYATTLTFENETTSPSPTRNNSVPSVINLTPQGSAYDCIVGTKGGTSGWCQTNGSSNSYGEIKWDGTKNLMILGTVYFDGSVSISNASAVIVDYTCFGSVYASGTILIKNTQLCGLYLDKNCAGTSGFGGWWPFANWLFFVADGDGATSSQGGQIPSGVGIKFIASEFQGGLFATKAIEFDATSNFTGPAIGSNLIFDGDFTSIWGQSSTQGGNASSNMPSGTPGISQNSKTQIQPPIYSGG
jgi:Tfp pilus assembly protein PilX